MLKLKFELKGTTSKRVVTVPGDLNLADFNDVLQSLFGFEHDHLWNFQDKKGREYNTCCAPFGRPLQMDMRGKLDPYGHSPCGSGRKFKFCCLPKYRDSINCHKEEAE